MSPVPSPPPTLALPPIGAYSIQLLIKILNTTFTADAMIYYNTPLHYSQSLPSQTAAPAMPPAAVTLAV